jgi:hypothetical protein
MAGGTSEDCGIEYTRREALAAWMALFTGGLRPFAEFFEHSLFEPRYPFTLF